MKRGLILFGLTVIVSPWLWAFTIGQKTLGEAQGAGTAAFYISLFTVPLGLLAILWGVLRKAAH